VAFGSDMAWGTWPVSVRRSSASTAEALLRVVAAGLVAAIRRWRLRR
jgi:hypothetical protein